MCLISGVCICVKFASAAHHLYWHLAQHLKYQRISKRKREIFFELVVGSWLTKGVTLNCSIGCHEPLVVWVFHSCPHTFATVYAKAVLLHTNILKGFWNRSKWRTNLNLLNLLQSCPGGNELCSCFLRFFELCLQHLNTIIQLFDLDNVLVIFVLFGYLVFKEN